MKPAPKVRLPETSGAPKPARKVKTSVSLSADLLAAVDSIAGRSGRSAWIERSVRSTLKRITRQGRDQRELDLLNANADALNREGTAALAYQASWDVE